MTQTIQRRPRGAIAASLYALAFVSGLTAEPAAKLIDVDFDELSAAADSIVVVRVTALASENDRMVASAEVLETIHGPQDPRGRVRFIASRTYAEDFSAARVGEVAMLFLVNRCGPGAATTRWYSEEAPTTGSARSDIPCIAANGRGRFTRVESGDRIEWRSEAGFLIVYPPSLAPFVDRTGELQFPDRAFRDAVRSAIATTP